MNTPSDRPRRQELLAWGALAITVAVLLLVPRPSGLFWDNLFDASHIGISFLIAVAGLRFSRRFLFRQSPKAWPHYLVSFGLVLGLGGGVEVLQFFVPGTPSLNDLLRDLAGGLSCLLLASSLDPTTLSGSARSNRGRWGLRAAGLGCLAAALAPIGETAIAVIHRRHAFPVLAGFASRWDARFIKTADGATLSIQPPPAAFHLARNGRVAKVIFSHRGTYPKVDVVGPLGNWSAYRRLVITVHSPNPAPVVLTLRVHDRAHRDDYQDRFNRRLTLLSGDNRISVPLEEIRNAPSERHLSLSDITSVALFAVEPRESITLYIDEFFLEE